MIDYKTLNSLLKELRSKNTSVNSKDFFERELGKSNETFKTHRLSIEKLTKDGYIDKLRSNYVIITPKGFEFEGYKKKVKVMEKKVFVSHSYNDRKIAERIINILLVDTLNINKSEIFFTSKRETGIRSSKTWREQIRKNIIDCQLFIAIITPSYHQSHMCQAELGAAWVTQKNIYSLYIAPITVKNFAVVIAERQADNIREKEEMQSFIEQLSEDFSTHYSRNLDLSNLVEGLNKFYRSLRSYLRENATDIGISYNENSKKNSKPGNINIPAFDTEVIKTKAINEYPNDYSTQEYVINEQKESYDKLKAIIKENLDKPELKIILENAISEWKDDYSMVVNTVEEQLDSLSRMK